jgi:hypothetical protein
MPISVKIIENLVGETKVGFGNAKEHLEIREKIIDFGYDDMRLDSLIDLTGRLDSKYHDQQTKRGEKALATPRSMIEPLLRANIRKPGAKLTVFSRRRHHLMMDLGVFRLLTI